MSFEGNFVWWKVNRAVHILQSLMVLNSVMRHLIVLGR